MTQCKVSFMWTECSLVYTKIRKMYSVKDCTRYVYMKPDDAFIVCKGERIFYWTCFPSPAMHLSGSLRMLPEKTFALLRQTIYRSHFCTFSQEMKLSGVLQTDYELISLYGWIDRANAKKSPCIVFFMLWSFVSFLSTNRWNRVIPAGNVSY